VKDKKFPATWKKKTGKRGNEATHGKKAKKKPPQKTANSTNQLQKNEGEKKATAGRGLA